MLCVRGAALAAAVLLTAVLVPGAPARAAACQQQVKSGEISKAVPYEDQLFAPDRLKPFATGAGVRVAVIDSGVDTSSPHLRGQVAAGKDFLHNEPDGRQDCVGHGTAVASIIAGRAVEGAGLRGLAPDATIVPVRVSEQVDTPDGGTTGEPASPARFAQAIRWAADPAGGNADVINMSLVMTDDSDQVEAAVSDAIAAGVVVVAAVGNHGAANEGNPDPYPALYDGVIGVGAVDAAGVKAGFSQHGPYVDLMAPGVGVTFAAPRRGQLTGSGTSFATPFVSATAALVHQRFPTLTPAQISRRILATADPAPGGEHSTDYGVGVLNPYRALTETLGPDTQAAPAPMVVHTDDPATIALARRRADAQHLSLIVAAAGAGVVLLVVLVAAAVRHGRRRGWRPAGQG
ncbi:type VII secretion-associated serine protease mycosin [Actinoplanes sp. N902-109]|uniref:type VII secretion-associated serine protease mycosin n=1 Tax=Actinoplanes sp. (strain N902-109) TaxID=649831 RepID=UPI0003295AC4|nr:type VII secretion-associated serine protease mycosin [Actinoplanes sp. N902-109]AGL17453.1 peptidase S8 and S53 subtilisin kexin sedolisin [Actinoplanes sp. N902-109]